MAYDSREHWKQQKCLAHLIRQLRELEQTKKRGAVRFPSTCSPFCRKRWSWVIAKLSFASKAAEPTNKRAERAIRPAVVARRNGGCNKNFLGAETHSILASILTTPRHRRIGAPPYLRSVGSSAERANPLLATGA